MVTDSASFTIHVRPTGVGAPFATVEGAARKSLICGIGGSFQTTFLAGVVHVTKHLPGTLPSVPPGQLPLCSRPTSERPLTVTTETVPPAAELAASEIETPPDHEVLPAEPGAMEKGIVLPPTVAVLPASPVSLPVNGMLALTFRKTVMPALGSEGEISVIEHDPRPDSRFVAVAARFLMAALFPNVGSAASVAAKSLQARIRFTSMSSNGALPCSPYFCFRLCVAVSMI